MLRPSRPRRLGLAALALVGLLAGLGLAQDDKPAKSADKPTDPAVAKLIDQLGSEDADVRKAAEKKLIDMGEGVLPAIRKAARDHADPDARLRCIVLSTTLVKRLYGEIRKYVGHTNKIRHLAVSKDGKKALTGGEDNAVYLWDIDTGKPLQKMTGHSSWAWQVAFAPDEKRAISSGGMDKTVRLWDLEDGKELKQFTGHKSRTYGAAIWPDGKHVAAGGGAHTDNGEPADSSIRIWSVSSGKQVKQLDGHTGYVYKLAISPDGKRLASIGINDYSLRIWNVEDPEEAKIQTVVNKVHEDGFVTNLAFSPDGKSILTCGRDETCKLFSAADGKLIRTFDGFGDNVEAVAFSRDGRRFLAGGNRVVHVVETATGRIIHRFEEHPGVVFAVAFLPGGTKALSAGADDNGKDFSMRLWNVPK